MTDRDAEAATSRHPGWSWLVFAAVAVALNLVWEIAQTPLYGTGELGQIRLGIWLRASVVDAVLITAAAAGADTARQLARHPQAVFWAVFVVALVFTGAYIEWTAIRTGRWSYSEWMPAIGVIGVSPLVQLAVTGVVALWLAAPQMPGDVTGDGR